MKIPYYPSKWEAVEKLIKTIELRPGTRFIDLGSGDGRILYKFASKYEDIYLYGIERNPLLINASMNRLRDFGDRVHITYGDLFNVNLNNYDVAYGYLTTEALKILRDKIINFVNNDKIFITFDFRIPSLKPIYIIPIGQLPKRHRLYIYGKERIVNKIINL